LAGTKEGAASKTQFTSRRKENNKINFKEIVFELRDWIYLAQVIVQWLAIVNTVMNIWGSWTVRNVFTNNIMTYMTIARQRLGKHFPEFTLSTTEESLKAVII
jgi:hypothetical protein